MRKMDEKLKRSLSKCEADIEGAMRRLNGDEALYISCLKSFLEDPTMETLDTAIAERSWDEAFTAAHALKGLAGNMGFVPLFHAVAELVLLIRAGRLKEIDTSNACVRRCYGDVINAINNGFADDTGR